MIEPHVMHEFGVKDMSQCAATIQIGFGNGSYGRRHGRVFRHKIQINTTYRNPKF